MIRPFSTALLYAALALFANPALAEPLSPAERAALVDLRQGDMRKLTFHAEPRQIGTVAFTGPDGAVRTLADSNGKVRIVNFWATWCAPCRQEKPSLDALQGDLGGADFEVIAIATGRNSDASIARFNEEVGIVHLAKYLDPKSTAARELAVLGLPVTLIVDRDGNEIARLQGGADWTSDSTRAILARLIAGGA